MSLATKGWAQPSMACEMGSPSGGCVAPVGRLWYKSAAHPTQMGSLSHKSVRYGYAPDVTAPRGWSAATDQKPKGR
jgi:hypothetical protein